MRYFQCFIMLHIIMKNHQIEGTNVNTQVYLRLVIIFGLRFAFFTHISVEKRTVSKYVR